MVTPSCCHPEHPLETSEIDGKFRDGTFEGLLPANDIIRSHIGVASIPNLAVFTDRGGADTGAGTIGIDEISVDVTDVQDSIVVAVDKDHVFVAPRIKPRPFEHLRTFRICPILRGDAGFRIFNIFGVARFDVNNCAGVCYAIGISRSRVVDRTQTVEKEMIVKSRVGIA